MINHRRKAPRIAALLVALAAAVAVAVEGQATATPTPGTTLHFTQVEKSFGFDDVPPKGGPGKPFSPGDAFDIGGRLLAGTKPVGSDDLVCTTTQPGKHGGSLCVGTLVLPGGQITFSGLTTVASSGDVYAVTGGTGTYAGASGTLETKEAKSGRTPITIQL